MTPVEFEPTIPADERPQIYVLDRAATGIGYDNDEDNKNNNKWEDAMLESPTSSVM
jgi:hypothetical protein